MHFSRTAYVAFIRLRGLLKIKNGLVRNDFHGTGSIALKKPPFKFSLSLKVDKVNFNIDLEDAVEKNIIISISIGDTDLRYALLESAEICILAKMVRVSAIHTKDESRSNVLCLSRNSTDSKFLHAAVEHLAAELPEALCLECSSIQGCLHLHCKAPKNESILHGQFKLSLKDVDFHVYPKIYSLLRKFLKKLNSESVISATDAQMAFIGMESGMAGVNVSNDRFSNIFKTENLVFAGLPAAQFPFVCAKSSVFPHSFGCSVTLGMPDLRSSIADEREYPKNFGSGSISASSSNFHCFNMISVYLSLNGAWAHFHDASCILGTITIPESIVSLSFLNTDCLDLLFSAQGLKFTSSWSSANVHEVLWGPYSANDISMFNLRVRKEISDALLPLIKVGISIQKACCILPHDLLAMLIGYFSLDDWDAVGNEHYSGLDDKREIFENSQTSISYKIEILDSVLILPVELHKNLCLKLGLPQLFCDLIPFGSLADGTKGIPSECFISGCLASEKIEVIDLFGTKLSVSLMLLSDQKNFLLKLDDYMFNKSISLIEKLDADLWFRTPWTMTPSKQTSSPIAIMMKAQRCEVIAEDSYFVSGLEAVADVIDLFSSVRKESKIYKTDVLQYLQLKRSLKEGTTVSVDISTESIIRMKASIQALSMIFSCHKEKDLTSEQVAKVHMRLDFSTVLSDKIPDCVDLDISSLVLQSFHSSSTLLSFVSDSSISSHLCINFSKRVTGGGEVLVTLPYLDVWLYLFDWDNIINHMSSYAKQTENNSDSFIGTPDILHQALDFPDSPYLSSEFRDANLSIKCENISISFHLPIWDKEEDTSDGYTTEMLQLDLEESFTHASADDVHSIQYKHYKFIKVSLQSKGFVVILGDSCVRSKCDLDRLKVMLEVMQKQKEISVPFFYLSQVKVGMDSQREQGRLVHFFFQIHADSLDVSFSRQIFNFWRNTVFKFPEASPSRSYAGVVLRIYLRRGSLRLSDGRWSYHGPIMESLAKNVSIQVRQGNGKTEASISADLLVNYNNIDKVMWEPFVEPWSFQVNLTRKHPGNVLNTSSTDIFLKSTDPLNLNVTEPLIEAVCRLSQMIKESLSSNSGGLGELGILKFRNTDDVHTRRYAPYILSNKTSLPLSFKVFRGPVNADGVDRSSVMDENSVPSGYSVPIYVEETLDDFFFQHRDAHSSEQLLERRMNAVAHHLISIQFEGTSGPSKPMSMDLVGVNYFEVNFSRSQQFVNPEMDLDSSTLASVRKNGKRSESGQSEVLSVPVVLEVSMQNYGKLIQLYSTVILFNATSVPLELRFDIPFGVSSQVLGPIFPGQEIPLPLHLSETGRIRWHPVGTGYLWSETHLLSSLLSNESRLGFMKSFVCYPSHPSFNPFRCCLSVHDYSLTLSDNGKKGSTALAYMNRQSTYRGYGTRIHEQKLTKRHFLRQLKLTTPLVVKNYLPTCLSLTIDCSGVEHSVAISEEGAASIFFVDSSHDLKITFSIQGYESIVLKFPRAEAFSSATKLNGSKFALKETSAFYSNASHRPLNVTLEKSMDAYCGARELCLSVPFLLYNCTDLLLTIMDVNHERSGNALIISPNHLSQQDCSLVGKDGLSILSSGCLPLKVSQIDGVGRAGSSYSLPMVGNDGPRELNGENKEVKPHMYAPSGHIPAGELLVKLSASLPYNGTENNPSPNWSNSFPLVPASGSTVIVVPQPCSFGAFLISATSVPVSGELSGRTKAITFQPRYVICNACNKDMCYRQKGTRTFRRLGSGRHSYLHWSDTTRELLVSIRFDGPGWQWSGSLSPDRLGDALVKIRNHVSGASNMVRVEVQNADLAINNGKIIGRANSTSTTQLILLSDDKTGYMPYRIDNFSMEKLRVYQQRCESIETIVYPYTSCQYAWDEPCYPHRLVIEVPGERILGTYNLDDAKEYVHVYLPASSEKPERKFCISLHAEGATKVLSCIDSNYHSMEDLKETGFLGFKETKDVDEQQDYVRYSEVITLQLPFIGISLISSSPQELLFACAKETSIVAKQSLDNQKISFQILSLQIDNQFSDTPYPVVLSVDNAQRGKSLKFFRNKENKFRFRNENMSLLPSENTFEPMFYLAAAKWRTGDTSLISYEYIRLGVAPMCIELEERLALSLDDFYKTISSRLHSRSMENTIDLRILDNPTDALKECLGNAHYSQKYMLRDSSYLEDQNDSRSLPSIVPVGAPWQQIYLLARQQKRIYVELFEFAPVNLSLSFTSNPWLSRSEVGSDVDTISFNSGISIQRGLLALIDVEGVPVHLGGLMMENLMASWKSIQDILVRHYTRQMLHEIYKVLGSAGVIGNPMGFARNVGIGIKDLMSASSKGLLQNPGELLHGIAQGSKTLFNSTIYSISSATTHFSKTAYKGVVAFTFDEQVVSEMDEHKKHLDLHGKGVLNGLLEGLTGLLQSPVRGAEKHGLPGVLSGIAMGTAGLVAKPVASILEATGKTAQSIRSRSNPLQVNRFRVRFPRPLARELPLLPYSWEEAIGLSMLLQADSSRLKDETFVMCKALKQPGRFLVLSERLLLIVWCPYLVDLGMSNFTGVPPDPRWTIETEMSLETIVHIDRSEEVVNIVGSNMEMPSNLKRGGTRSMPWSPCTSTAFFNASVELPNKEEAEDILQVILSRIEKGKTRRWDRRILGRINLA